MFWREHTGEIVARSSRRSGSISLPPARSIPISQGHLSPPDFQVSLLSARSIVRSALLLRFSHPYTHSWGEIQWRLWKPDTWRRYESEVEARVESDEETCRTHSLLEPLQQ